MTNERSVEQPYSLESGLWGKNPPQQPFGLKESEQKRQWARFIRSEDLSKTRNLTNDTVQVPTPMFKQHTYQTHNQHASCIIHLPQHIHQLWSDIG